MDKPITNTVALVVPLLDGGQLWIDSVRSIINSISLLDFVLVIDSGSSDGGENLAKSAGFHVITINKKDFNHGGTRQYAATYLKDYEIIVFMTQDAVLASKDSIKNLISVFSDQKIGAAYGRQLPRNRASPIEAHTRLFNYPDVSCIKKLSDKDRLGIKIAFISNSFAAYRTKTLIAVGGFPEKVIMGEDMVVAARILQAGWYVSYVAEAQVYHSHDYSVVHEFKRYFDIGAMHQDQAWILREFGKPQEEGRRFVRSELAYLKKHAPFLLPAAFVRAIAKYMGYKIGQHAFRLPLSLRQKLSMHRSYWNDYY